VPYTVLVIAKIRRPTTNLRVVHAGQVALGTTNLTHKVFSET
jgi:hypothetical protein